MSRKLSSGSLVIATHSAGKLREISALLGPFGLKCLAIAWPDGEYATYEGLCSGALTWPPRGEMGFGYDPVFVPSAREGPETFAEIDPTEKHAISHRADAFAKLVSDQFGNAS